MYLQGAKWVASLGFVIFFIQSVYSLPASCWQQNRRAVIEALLWCTVGLFGALAVSAAITYNALGKKDPAARWETRLRWISRLLGCHRLVTRPLPRQQGQGQQQGGRAQDEQQGGQRQWRRQWRQGGAHGQQQKGGSNDRWAG